MSVLESTIAALPPQAPHLKRRRFDGALVVLFVGAICLPMAGRLTGIAAPYDPNIDHRNAAEFPQIGFRQRGPISLPRKGDLVAFPSKFEAYFGDHLGFRNSMLEIYAAIRERELIPQILTQSVGTSDKSSPVLVGREGWLYLNGDCVDNYRNIRPFTETELDAWVAALQQRYDWCARRNIRYLFFVAPDKATIYPEYMPTVLNRVRTESRLDQLMARLAKSRAVPAIDLRPALLAAKSQRQVYYQTDMHWNSHGAWVCLQEMQRALQPWFPHWPTPSSAAYKISQQIAYTGDLAVMLRSTLRRDPAAFIYEPAQPSVVKTSRNMEPLETGTVEREHAENAAAPNGRIFVCHDSFFAWVIPFLNDQWQYATYVSNRYPFPAELIERERPDVVIEEFVERKLLGPPPRHPPSVN